MKAPVALVRPLAGFALLAMMLVAVLVPARRVCAQDTPAPTVMGGHGWVVDDRVSSGANALSLDATAALLHIPPRGIGAGAERGTIRFATASGLKIERVAWWRERVYYVTADEPRNAGPSGTLDPSDSVRLRSVWTLRAVRVAGAGYAYGRGRAEALPALTGDPDLVGLVGGPTGPVALLRERLRVGEERRADGTLRTPAWMLKRLDVGLEDAWREEPLPFDASGLNVGDVQLVNWAGGFAIVRATPGESSAEVWIGRMGGLRVTGRKERFVTDAEVGPPAPVVWEKRSVALGPASGWKSREFVAVESEQQGATDGATLLALGFHDTALEIVRVGDGDAKTLCVLEDLPKAGQGVQIVPMSAAGAGGSGAPESLALVWIVRRQTEGGVGSGSRVGAESSAARIMMMREVSVQTGRVLFDGPVRSPESPISKRDLQGLLFLVIVVMIALLVFVLRAEPGAAMSLGPGVTVADPVRRMFAGVLDYIPAAVAAAMILKMEPTALLSIGKIGAGESWLGPLGLAMLIGAAHSALGEWLIGRSLGKVVAGVRVVSRRHVTVAEGDAEPTWVIEPVRPWQALMRNLIRWVFPIGLMMLMDAAKRHPGDLAARTLVVMDEPEDVDEE